MIVGRGGGLLLQGGLPALNGLGLVTWGSMNSRAWCFRRANGVTAS